MDKPIKIPVPTFCDLFIFSAFASDPDSLVSLDHKQIKAAFTRS